MSTEATPTPPAPELVPEPIEHGAKELMETAFTWGTIAAAAGGAMLFATTFGRTHTSGATHSAKIEWSKRQAEIQQVVQADQAKPELIDVNPTAISKNTEAR